MAPGSLCERGVGLRREEGPLQCDERACSQASWRVGAWRPAARRCWSQSPCVRARRLCDCTKSHRTGRPVAHGCEERARAPLVHTSGAGLLTLPGPPHLPALHWPRHLHPSRDSKHPLHVETWGGLCGRQGEGDSGCALRDLPASHRSPHSPHPAGRREVTWVRVLTAALY